MEVTVGTSRRADSCMLTGHPTALHTCEVGDVDRVARTPSVASSATAATATGRERDPRSPLMLESGDWSVQRVDRRNSMPGSGTRA